MFKSLLCVQAYCKKIIQARYFWMHLAWADIRAKYRRSFLGPLWSMLQPLTMTLLLAFVMSSLFGANMLEYSLFIFSGIIFWDYMVSSSVAGCNAFIQAEGYIKQMTQPLLIYTLRHSLSGMIHLLIGFCGLVLMALIVKPENFGWSWLSMLIGFFLLLFIAWPLATITAFTGTKFRDFSYLIALGMQAIWYISPIFLEPSLFHRANIAFLVEYNPIYHLLELFRAPILHGEMASIENYAYVVGSFVFLWIFAIWMTIKGERELIFYF